MPAKMFTQYTSYSITLSPYCRFIVCFKKKKKTYIAFGFTLTYVRCSIVFIKKVVTRDFKITQLQKVDNMQ